jgi:tRNA(adenine34) deaminase
VAEDHVYYMQHALRLAKQALEEGEFPVGCIMVYNGRVIAQGQRVGTRQASPGELDHAEIIALRQLESLNEPVDRSRIKLYATLEPCMMCFGALLISGIGTIVYAYEDAMGGATACDRRKLPVLYRDSAVRIIPGISRQQSLELFRAFFSDPHLDYWRDSHLARYTLSQG